MPAKLTPQVYSGRIAKSIDVIPDQWDEVRVAATAEKKEIRQWLNEVIADAIERRRKRVGERAYRR